MSRLVYSIAVCVLLAGGPLSARNVPVIDYGADMGSGELRYRDAAPESARYFDGFGGDARLAGMDVTVSAWPFSLETPLNPPGLRYNTLQKSAQYYGGLVLFATNPARFLTEGHLNANHELRDDSNFMALGRGPIVPGEQFEAYAVWLWQKADFRNGADKLPVRFNERSRISVHVSRYWGGVHAGRWVVRDGTQFFVSEQTFGGQYRLYTGADKENPVVHTTHSIAPAATKWAEWNPQPPYGIAFRHANAEFKAREFNDVTAAGFLATRELAEATKAVPGGLSSHQPLAVKWNAFRCDADVEYPENAPHHVRMRPLSSAGSGVELGVTEVSFALWQQITSAVVTNQYPSGLGDLGYAFENDGSMGSMRLGEGSHTAEEPVCDVSWLDAVLFCNALSEQEGFTPAYYADPEHKTVLRRGVDRNVAARAEWRPAVYWKQSADGFRLPTRAEWLEASGTSAGPLKGSDKTQPCGTGAANAAGFHDLAGNVWEWVWDAEDAAAKADPSSRLAMGGDFLAAPEPSAANPGDRVERPFMGSYNIGFRLARNASGGTPILRNAPPTGVAAEWRIERTLRIPPEKPLSREVLAGAVRAQLRLRTCPAAGRAASQDGESPLATIERRKTLAEARNNRFLGKITDDELAAIEAKNVTAAERPPFPLLVGETEVSYALWNRVASWAEANGYAFNYRGDIGSMRHLSTSAAGHQVSEPVTGVSWHDAVVWCNALSELQGLTPAYYLDSAHATPYRKAQRFRVETHPRPGYPNPPWQASSGRTGAVDTAMDALVFFKPDSDGFRLPLHAEFSAFAPVERLDPDVEWVRENADGRTHPVGTRRPSAFGLYDLHGNVLEWCWDEERPHTDVLSGLRLGGNGYYYEAAEPLPPAGKAFHSEYAAVARPFVGFRVVRRTGTGVTR